MGAKHTIFTVQSVLDRLETMLDDLEGNATEFPLWFARFEAHSTVLSRIQCLTWDRHYANLRAAIREGRKDKTRIHMARLRKVVRPVRNDSPANTGDRV